MQEAQEGDEAVGFHNFPESAGACNKIVAGPLTVALIPRFGLELRFLGAAPCGIKKQDEYLAKFERGNLIYKQQNFQQYLLWQRLRNVSVAKAGSSLSEKFQALSGSVCRTGLASTLKYASEQTDSCK